MARGTKKRTGWTRRALTAQEIVNIKGWHEGGVSLRTIRMITGRSKAALQSILARSKGDKYEAGKPHEKNLTGLTPEPLPHTNGTPLAAAAATKTTRVTTPPPERGDEIFTLFRQVLDTDAISAERRLRIIAAMIN